ncbi:hypothetical protein M405DRAFT_746907, partial [Rhizopogon salebrosus TDB-379]
MVATGRNTNYSRSSNCSTCGKGGHSAQDCFQRGGAMEGKRDEVMARRRAARDFTGKPGGLRYDTGGRAYLLDSETHEVIYITSSAQTSPPGPVATTTTEFAGLAYDSIPPTIDERFMGSGDNEYDALCAVLGQPLTSVDWRTHTQPADFAGITYKAPSQCQRSVIDPSVIPFFLDSGASVHISNTESDFYNLRPIPPRVVNGVGGSSIHAVGVGSVRLII